MPTVYALLPDSKPQFLDSNGDPASGAKLFVYTSGSSTKVTTYTESDGLTANSNPVVLDSRGEPPSGVYVESGTYKLVLAPSTDTDPPASVIWTRDNLTAINDTAAGSVSEWIDSGFTPTFVSTTSFTVPGDQTSILHLGRRLKTTNSGGTIYSTITASAFTSLTTITVENDSGVLDSGISAVAYGLLSANNPSAPALQVVEATNNTSESIAGNIPVDDTIPQSSEGTQILSVTITPVSSANTLRFRAIVNIMAGGTSVSAALFANGTADALAAVTDQNVAANLMTTLVLEHSQSAGSTTAQTFDVNAGAVSGNFRLNGSAGTRLFGGVLVSRLIVWETQG